MTGPRAAFKSVVWNHAGRSAEYLLLYCVGLLIARTLGPELNGTFAFFLGLSQFLLLASSLGLETTLTSQIPRLLQGGGEPAAAGTIRLLATTRFLTGVAVSAVFLIAWKSFGSFLNAPGLITEYLLILAFYFAARGVVSLLAAFLTAKLETRTTAIVGVGVRTIELLGVVYLLHSGSGLVRVLILITLTSCLQLFLLLAFSRDFLFQRASIPAPRGTLLLGLKFWANGLMEFFLGRQADILLLSAFLVGTAAMGQYDVALGFSQAINFGLTAGLAGVSIAAFSYLAVARPDRLPKYWEGLARIVLAVVLPPFLFVGLFATKVVPAVYSDSYLPSVPLFQGSVMFLAATRLLGGGLAADYLQAAGRTRQLLLSSSVSGFTNLVLAILLIPRYGTYGAMVATGVAALVIAALHALFVHRELGVAFPLRIGLVVGLLGAVSAFLTVLLVPDWAQDQPALLLLVYTAALLALSYLAKPVPWNDAELLREMSPGFGAAALQFSRPQVPEGSVPLTDRQKWAYAWMTESGIVLDIGSSSGPLTPALATKGRTVIALDPDRAALEVLGGAVEPVHPIEAGAHHLPVRTASVDAVLLLDVLEHVTDERRTIGEAARVLRPGGVVILSVPHRGLFTFLDPQNLSAGIKGRSASHSFHRHYDMNDVTRLLGKEFRIERHHYGGLFLYPITFGLNAFVRKHLHLNLSFILKKVGDLDNDVSWGRLSYNLIVKARRV